MNNEKALDTRIRKISEIIGNDVEDSQGNDVGKIDDIIVTQSGGWAPYIILDYEDSLYTVPWKAMLLQAKSGGEIGVSLIVDREKIENAQNFNLANLPDITKPQWGDRICDYFGCEPVWAEAGSPFQGSEGEDQQAYELSNAKTINGQVVKVYQFTPMKDMPEIIAADMKAEDGEMYTVHLGPVWYLSSQPEEIQEDDTISVKGVKTLMGNEPAIIAAEIRRGSHLLRLRDERGMPSWNAWTLRKNLEIHRASNVLGVDVESIDEKKIGKVEHLALNVDEGRVLYAILSTSGLGGKNLVVPWNALELSLAEDKFLIHFNKDQMVSAPGFDDEWPDMSDEKWMTEVHKFYTQ
jgi:sporulation protein YlmC with PRC-barrel domain